MSNVTIVKGSLFDAPKDSIICHAVNCQGAWGSGIAAVFRTLFPEAYGFYRDYCKEYSEYALGSTLLLHENDYTIGCLFTSRDYGRNVDTVEMILKATKRSVEDLIRQNTENKDIHMCKINSGLFGVPWELTEKVLEYFPDQKFTVWEL